MQFQVTATNRYDINVVGDVYIDNVYNHSFSICLGDYNSGTYNVMLEPISWPCGADMKVELLNDGPVTIIIDTKNKE